MKTAILPADPDKEFPLFVYFYDATGQHGKPHILRSQEELKDFKTLLQVAIASGNEVIIADIDECTVLHANKGRLIFP